MLVIERENIFTGQELMDIFDIAKEVTKYELEIIKKYLAVGSVVSCDKYDIYTVSQNEETVEVICCEFKMNDIGDVINYSSIDYWLNQLYIYGLSLNIDIHFSILKIIQEIDNCKELDDSTRCLFVSKCIENYQKARFLKVQEEIKEFLEVIKKN